MGLGTRGVPHHIVYEPRNSIKGQVVADILADFPVDDTTGIQEEIERIQRYRDEIPEAISPDLPEEEGKDEAAAELEERHGWTLFVAGSCNSYGSGAGVVLVDPSGVKIEKSIRIGFSASNNEAEYEALIATNGFRPRCARSKGLQ